MSRAHSTIFLRALRLHVNRRQADDGGERILNEKETECLKLSVLSN